MAGKRTLQDGAPRLLGNHNTLAGKRFRRCYSALVERYGPFSDQVLRMEAARCAAAWTEYQASTVQLAEARAKLSAARVRHGQGWNAQAIQRLSKRVGLNDATYAAALRRLEELAAPSNGHAFAPGSPEAALHAMTGGR
jgi:hypothetical protein